MNFFSMRLSNQNALLYSPQTPHPPRASSRRRVQAHHVVRQEGASEGQALRAVGRGRGPGLRRAEPGVLLPAVTRAVQPVLRPVRVLRQRHVHGPRVADVGVCR